MGEKERYHGIALHRLITASDSGATLRVISGFTRSAYLLNDRAVIYFKYSTNRLTPWPFVFADDQRRDLDILSDRYQRVELALICGFDGIVGMNFALVGSRLEALGQDAGFSLQVKRRHGQRYRVTGIWSDEVIVAEASFPRTVFEWLDRAENQTS